MQATIHPTIKIVFNCAASKLAYLKMLHVFKSSIIEESTGHMVIKDTGYGYENSPFVYSVERTA
jgi:hypothetical protein